MLSTFSPRIVSDKNGVVKLRNVKNNKKFDSFYIDQTIKITYKRVGEGPEDFVPVTHIVESKRDISEVINSQNRDVVNIDESVKRFVETGDLTVLAPGVQTADIVDFTKLPEDHADYMAFMNKVAAEYDNLPEDLKGKMTMADFIQKMDDKKINDYILSKMPKQKDKEEVVNHE